MRQSACRGAWTRDAGQPGRAAMALLVALTAVAPSMALAAGDLTRGPVVSVLPCAVMGSGCGLDPSTPDLSPSGCAEDLAALLGRRGITARVVPQIEGDLCAVDPQALVMTATVTAACPVTRGVLTPKDYAQRTRLRADLALRDCVGGGDVGRGNRERPWRGGRLPLLGEALDDLGQSLDESGIRRTHPGTPARWMRGDTGGWRAFEARFGQTKIENSDLNDYFEGIGLDRDKHAWRALVEWAYYPWTIRGLRFSLGVDARRAEWQGDGRIDLLALHVDPSKYWRFDPDNPRYDPNSGVLYDPYDAIHGKFGALGLRTSLGWGIDVTRNQHVSFEGAVGYYTLGTGILPARIDVEGLPSDMFELRSAATGLEGAVRWEWRIFSHVGVSLSAGWSQLSFNDPDRPLRKRFFPIEVSFSGPEATVGLMGRF